MSQAELIPTSSPTFSPVVHLHSGRPATTSLDVARYFGKRHDNVLRDVDELLSQLPENSLQLNFEETFQAQETPIGRKQTRMFTIYRDGFMLLVMGYNGKKALAMKLAYIDAFNRMEAALAEKAALPPEDAPITPADQSVLQAIVRARVEAIPADQRGKGLYPQIWSRFNNHFRLGSYKQLPQCRMADAVTYLTQMDVRAKALPAAAPTRPRAAGDEERYLRFLERLEKTRRLINEHSSELCLEAARLLPKELLQKKQFGNALGWLIRWIMEEITSPTPRGGLLRDDNDSPLYILMQYGK